MRLRYWVRELALVTIVYLGPWTFPRDGELR